MSAQPSRLALEVALEETGDRTLTASGVIDSHTAGELSEQLRVLGSTSDIQLDLRAVEFIDSSGLRSIITGHQALDSAGNKLRLTGVSDAVTRLLEITGLHDHLHLG